MIEVCHSEFGIYTLREYTHFW